MSDNIHVYKKCVIGNIFIPHKGLVYHIFCRIFIQSTNVFLYNKA